MANSSAPLPANFFDPTPVANYASTIHAVCATLLSFVWISIICRMYARIFITKTQWWDDVFCVLAMLMVSLGTISFAISTKYGMGQHIYLLTNPKDIENILICHYLFGAAYVTATAFIKLSLLLQYLRVFEPGTWIYRFTQFLIVFIALWGFSFAFLSWFPCLPDPSAWWKMTNTGCYATASPDTSIVIKSIESHGGMNMILDFIVLSVPLRILFEDDAPSTRIGLAVLLFMGVLTCAFSVWRLENIVATGAGAGEDPTWNEPKPGLLSIAEVCIATICASVPFFWPVITEALNKIFVTYEFNVSTESRFGDDQIELAHTKSKGSKGSIRSVDSRYGDIKPGNRSHSSPYGDDYIQSQVNPFAEEFQTRSTVMTGMGSKGKKGTYVQFDHAV